MGKWVHRLIDINETTCSATCANCGPVAVKLRHKGGNRSRWHCLEKLHEMDNARRQTPAYKEYMGKYALQWKRLNKDKVSKVNRSQLLKAHGLTDADYEKMVLDRDGRCDICGATPTRLCVDHCHTTMAIRGLLCTNCNLGLGYFKDSLPALENAHTYLKKQP